MKKRSNDLISHLSSKKFIIVSGKGGVGKTTFSAALGLRLSSMGRKTLVVSIDPAHSLGDAFDVELSSEIREIRDNLYALEFDPIQLFSAEKEALLRAMEEEGGVLPFAVDEESLDLLLDFQFPYEFAEGIGFIKLIYSLIETEKFDNIVVDTAPTGHTICLLYTSPSPRDRG